MENKEPAPVPAEQFRELAWFRDLIVAMLRAGYSINSIATMSVEDWHESFTEGMAPIEALQEDESNG